MGEKEYRYKEHLDKYKKCPTEEFIERDISAFRWAYSNVSSEDFLPQVFSTRYPEKNLTIPKPVCKDFSLSLFDTLESAKNRYFELYKPLTRPDQREIYIRKKGDAIIKVSLKKEDGVSDEPNKYGHFSFFEYDTFDYSQRTDLSEKYSIFAKNEADNKISD